MIKVSNLSRSYGDFKAVKDISFEVGKGEIVGLLGPNGAGKTTLMKILTGFHFPTSGSAEVAGINIEENPQGVQSLVGYLPENAPLYLDLTVWEYLEFIAGVKEIPKEQIPGAIEKALGLCALGNVRYKIISHLSKGYRQRVGLAQAIIADPAIIIMDEPTNGLDPNQILEFRELIRTIGKEKTVILSTHIMQEVEALCPQLIIMNEGQIVARGKTEDITAQFQGESVVSITLKGVGTDQVLRELQTLKQVVSVSLDGAGENPTFSVVFPKTAPASEILFDWAVAKGYKILALIPQTLSLEDLFSKLTKEASS